MWSKGGRDVAALTLGAVASMLDDSARMPRIILELNEEKWYNTMDRS